MQRIKNIAITRRLLPLLSYATHYFCGSGGTDAVGHLLNGDYFWLKTETRANKQNYKDMATLETLNFDNLVLRTLPIDDEKENYTRQVSGACFSLVKPTPVDKPKVVSVSLPAMQLLDLHEDQVKRPDFASYFSGNLLPEGSETAAHCYCGHQFGHFSGQLGDGAAMYLGEIINKNGERWEIQLKGAGKTPYSRSADGRKVLRSTIREFLCSEAMHHLGIPTTRAGCCVTSESKVIRDVFYNGNAIQERCSIVLRIAQSFIRFGSFEIFKGTDMETGRKGPSTGRHDILELMLQYVIKTFYANIWEAHKEDKTQAYLAFYKEILTRTASLVAGWQCVGFCHGVLNTDNMSIVGVTIDYGPYGFMDSFDPSFICNASDDGGRYSYENQPEICKWNLLKLAEALQPIVPMEKMKEILETYDDVYESFYLQRMRQKLGLRTEKSGDQELIESFLSTLAQTGGDFTNCFRCLSLLHLPGLSTFTDSEKEVKTRLLSQCCTVEELKKSAQPRMDPRQLSTFMMLMQMNPDLLAQLGSDQKAISQELKRIEKSQQLKDLTQEEKQAKDEELWEAWLNKYISRLGEETGSEKVDVANAERIRLMNSVNPRIVLRNYIAQMAIEKAEGGDFSEVHRVLSLLQQPFSDHTEMTGLQGGVAAMTFNKESSTAEESKSKASTSTSDQPSHVTVNYEGKPPSWAADLRVT